MGTTRYADAGGSNTSPYDTWAKGATNPQTIIDLAVVDDDNHYKGTFTLSAPLDFDTNAGSATAGVIKHIGHNANESLDGTRVLLDGDGSAANCINLTQPFHWFENIECESATGNNVAISATGDSFMFVNCISHTAGADGFGVDNNALAGCFVRTKSFNNTNWGWDGYGSYNKFVACVAYGNGDGAINTAFSNGKVLDGFLSHDNGDNDNNIESYRYDYISHSAIDGTNQTGETGVIDIIGDTNLIMFNRFTNMAEGLDAGSRTDYYGWNLFYDNTADTTNDAFLYPIPLDATADTNDKTDGDADDGYNAVGTDDFNLKADRTYNGDGDDVIGMNIGS